MFKRLSDRPVAEVQNQQVEKWKEEDLLKKCVDAREGKTPFIFYEGPPTANGKPGIHHVMARTLKDSVCRYKTMQGYQVNRKAGWDTHGLPVEIEVEKQLNMSGKQDIEKYGIKAESRYSPIQVCGERCPREWAIWWIWIILTSLSKMIISRRDGGY